MAHAQQGAIGQGDRIDHQPASGYVVAHFLGSDLLS
jgi:hypothetical protein